MPVITVALKEGKSYRSPKYNNLAITDKPHKMTVGQAMFDAMKADGLLTVTVVEDDPAPPRPAAPAAKPGLAATKPGAPKVPAGNPLAPKPKPAPAAKPAVETDDDSNAEE